MRTAGWNRASISERSCSRFHNGLNRSWRKHSPVLALGAEKARKLIYRLGSRCFRDQLLLRWAAADASANEPQWRALLSLAETWTIPKFPLGGADAKALGVEAGPRLGALLKAVEQYWIDQDFKPDRAALLARLKDAVKSSGD